MYFHYAEDTFPLVVAILKTKYLKTRSIEVIQKVRNSGGVGVCTTFVTNCYEKCKGWGCQVTLVT